MEKRKEPRALVSFPIACNTLPQKKYFYTVCKDLSNEGVKIISNDFLKKGESFKVNLDLIDESLAIKAEVRWCTKQRYADRYFVGLRFTDINERSKGHLSQFMSLTQKGE